MDFFEFPSETITVEQGGDSRKVEVRGLSRKDVIRIMREDEADDDYDADDAFVIECARDPETGEPMFDDADPRTFGERVPAGASWYRDILMKALELTGAGAQTGDIASDDIVEDIQEVAADGEQLVRELADAGEMSKQTAIDLGRIFNRIRLHIEDAADHATGQKGDPGKADAHSPD